MKLRGKYLFSKLNEENKKDFHDYCWLYASDIDQSFYPLTEDFEIKQTRPGFLLYENDEVMGAVCLILDDSFTHQGKGRLMIFHSRIKEVDVYSDLLKKVLPLAEEKEIDLFFAFLPEKKPIERYLYKGSGFKKSRTAIHLKRELKRSPSITLPEGFSFRHFKPSNDMDTWCSIINTAYREVPGHIPYTPGMVEEDIETDSTFPGSARFLTCKGKPVGLLYCSLEASDELWISQLAVLPDFRKRGLGKILLRKCLQYAWEFNADCAFTLNAENIAGFKLFKSEGFKIISRYIAYVFSL